MVSHSDELMLCVATYKRPGLLGCLLNDLLGQSVLPAVLLIVDGDPGSGGVRTMLEAHSFVTKVPTWWIPSNHANLPYQRYLAYRAVKRFGEVQFLLYLDDDLRIDDRNAVGEVLVPFVESGGVAGVTGTIVMGGGGGDSGDWETAWLRQRSESIRHNPLRRLGLSQGVAPGGLTPVGTRVLPEGSAAHLPVEWLRGGVMAYSLAVLSDGCFPDDLFALAEIGAGLGEDTIISMIAGTSGPLFLAQKAMFLHPHHDSPKAYASDAFRYGWAAAYSRRLVNDFFCQTRKQNAGCRVALLRHYVGHSLVQLYRAFRKPSVAGWRCLLGTAAGVGAGLVSPPRASRLTPGTNWRLDAEGAVAAMTRVGS